MALRASNDPQYWRDRAEEARAIAVQVMDAHMSENNANDLAELGQDILTFDASDDSLERAALVTDGLAITINRMSALAHKRTSQHVRAMSALPPKADIDRSHRESASGIKNPGLCQRRTSGTLPSPHREHPNAMLRDT